MCFFSLIYREKREKEFFVVVPNHPDRVVVGDG
jgi:hypothetical protein